VRDRQSKILSQFLNDWDSAGTELAFGIVLADDQFCADGICFGENIDDFQATRFGNATGGVETNPKESVVAVALQTFVEQEFNFLLGEYLDLPVFFYFMLSLTRLGTRKFVALTALTLIFTTYSAILS
jgi:hypothetical protein